MFGNRFTLAAAAIVLAAYIGAIGLLPKEVFWSPDSGARYLQLRSIRWNRGLEYVLPYPGVVTDPGYEFYASRCNSEQLYPSPHVGPGIHFHWPIWFTLAAGILHRGFGWYGLFLLPMLCGWLVALFSARLMGTGREARRYAPVVVLLVGLGSPICFYSLCFWEHTVVTLLGVVALRRVAAAPPGCVRPWLIALPLLLGAMLLRVEMVAFFAATLVAWGITALAERFRSPETDGPPAGSAGRARGRRVEVGTLLAVATASLLVVFFALPKRYGHWGASLSGPLGQSLQILPKIPEGLTGILINSSTLQGPMIGRSVEIIALIAFATIAIGGLFMHRRFGAACVLLAAVVALQISVYVGMLRQSYVTLHGLFPVAPYIAFAFHALPRAWLQRQHQLFTTATAAAAYLLFGFGALFSYFARPAGPNITAGLEWGSRYLLTLYPIGAALAVVVLADLWRAERQRILARVTGTVLVAMMLVGGYFEVRGFFVLGAEEHHVQTWERALSAERQPIMTDIWWLPAALAGFSAEHEMHCVTNRRRTKDWLFADAARSVDRFTFASFGWVNPADIAPDSAAVRLESHEYVAGLRLSRFRVARTGADSREADRHE